MMWREFVIQTRRKVELVSVTDMVLEAAAEQEVGDGLCVVYVPHTTAGVIVNENADPDVASDLEHALEKMVPDLPYRHSEGNSPAHLKAALVGTSVSLPVIGGRLALGTWQGVYFCEFDGPRRRRMMVGLSKG